MSLAVVLVVDVYLSLLMPLARHMHREGCILEAQEIYEPEQVFCVFGALNQVNFSFYYAVHVEVEPNLVALVAVLPDELENQPEDLSHNLKVQHDELHYVVAFLRRIHFWSLQFRAQRANSACLVVHFLKAGGE